MPNNKIPNNSDNTNNQNSYVEKEIKILDINIPVVQKKLENLGAKLVFDDDRTFTTFDTPDRKYTKKGMIIRLTEEGKLKLSVSAPLPNNEKETVKVFTSRKKETVDFLNKLGLIPIAQVKSHRISYEWGKVDFDIDKFPHIPPFMEIDIEFLEIPLDQLLQKLNLQNNKSVKLGTEQIFQLYNLDYFDIFKI